MKPPRHPNLYRAILSCKIGRDAIERTARPPDGLSPTEYALYNLLHAVEEIATAFSLTDEHSPKSGPGAAGAQMQGRSRDTASQQTHTPNAGGELQTPPRKTQ